MYQGSGIFMVCFPLFVWDRVLYGCYQGSVHLWFVSIPSRQALIQPKLTLNSFCSWGWSWTPGPNSSPPEGLRWRLVASCLVYVTLGIKFKDSCTQTLHTELQHSPGLTLKWVEEQSIPLTHCSHDKSYFQEKISAESELKHRFIWP